MVERADRLDILTGPQCRPLWVCYLLAFPLILLTAFIGWGIVASLRPGAFGPARIARDLPVLLLPFVALLPIALWRNRFSLNRSSARLRHRWGYPFFWFGSKDYELGHFTSVEIAGVRPYWSTPGGRITPPMSDGFVNAGQRLYYDVELVGRERLLLQEFHSYAGAARARRRIASFLRLPCEPEPAPKTPIGPHLHAVLFSISAVAGMITGVAMFLALLGPIAAAGGSLSRLLGISWFAPIPGFAGFVLFSMAGIAAGNYLVSLIPSSCPRCGGKARLRWTDGPPGLGWCLYRCSECGEQWAPPRSR